jgi:hypothetical protein
MPFDPHQRARRLIDEALVDGISPADERWLHDHIRACTACAAHQEVAASIVRELRSISFELDPEMAGRVQTALAGRSRPHRALPRRLVIAAALFLLAAAPIYRTIRDRRSQTQTEAADALLERVDARVSRMVPVAMQPLVEPGLGDPQ